MDLRKIQADRLADERKVTAERLKKGALILATFANKDGFKFHNRETKPKRIIIIGADAENDVCYGSVIVNTDKNPQASTSAEIRSTQYVLHQEDYPEFLDYDSYADCAKILSLPMSKMVHGEYFGRLKPKDNRNISHTLETITTISNKEKIRYGLLTIQP